MGAKIFYLVVSGLMNHYYKIFSSMNHLLVESFKVLLSVALNFLLYYMIKPSGQKKNRKQILNSSVSKLVIALSFMSEMFYKALHRDILSVTQFTNSIIYEDLIEDSFDRIQLVILEVLRICMMVMMYDDIKIAFLVLSLDFTIMFLLLKAKDIFYQYVHTNMQSNDSISAQLANSSKILDNVHSSLFLLSLSSDFIIEFKNDKAIKLGEDLWKNIVEARKNDKDSGLLNITGFENSTLHKARVDMRNEKERKKLERSERNLQEFLGLQDGNKLLVAMRKFVLSRSEDSELLSGYILIDPLVSYDIVLKPVEWMSGKRLLLEINQSKYQNIKLASEMIDMCQISNDISFDKFTLINEFVRKARSGLNTQHHRIASALSIFNNELINHMDFQRDFIQSLSLITKEENDTLSPMDLLKVENMLKEMAERVIPINLNRRNKFTLSISSYFSRGCYVRYEYLSKLIHIFFNFCISNNIGNNFDVKISVRQSNDISSNLEFTFNGISSDSYSNQVLNILLGESLSDLKDMIMEKFNHCAEQLLMIHYLKKVLNIKCKIFGTEYDAQNDLIKGTPTTSYQFSKLNPIDGDMNMEENYCTTKFILNLDDSNMMNRELDKKGNKVVYSNEPVTRYIDSDQMKAVNESKKTGVLMNPNTAILISKLTRPIPVGWAATQSFCADIDQISSDIIADKLIKNENILKDKCLGAIEEELFHWNLKLGSLMNSSPIGSLSNIVVEMNEPVKNFDIQESKTLSGPLKLKDGIRAYQVKSTEEEDELSNQIKRGEEYPIEVRTCQLMVVTP